MNLSEKVSFIWSVADLLCGRYKPPQYGRVIVPLVVLRRLDCVLARTKDRPLAKYDPPKGTKVEDIEPILNRITGVPLHNTSKLDFGKLKGKPDKIAANLTKYIKGCSSKAREIREFSGFDAEIAKIDQANRLYPVVSKFCDIDLHTEKVPNIEMGYIFEELIRKFNEAANETAGGHFTPRESFASWSTCCLTRIVMFSPKKESFARCSTRRAARTACSPSPQIDVRNQASNADKMTNEAVS